MGQEKLNPNTIDQNVASTCTIFSAKGTRSLDYNRYEDYVLGLISKIYQNPTDRYLVVKYMSLLNGLFSLDIPQLSRPYLFSQLNSLMGTVMIAYRTDNEMFKVCFSMMTAFKKQIDQTPQDDEELNEIEWQELEKPAYLLTDWEDLTMADRFLPAELAVDEIKN